MRRKLSGKPALTPLRAHACAPVRCGSGCWDTTEEAWRAKRYVRPIERRVPSQHGNTGPARQAGPVSRLPTCRLADLPKVSSSPLQSSPSHRVHGSPCVVLIHAALQGEIGAGLESSLLGRIHPDVEAAARRCSRGAPASTPRAPSSWSACRRMVDQPGPIQDRTTFKIIASAVFVDLVGHGPTNARLFVRPRR